MKLSRQMRAITPMLHARELFWLDGGPTAALDEEDMAFYQQYRQMQYYREQNGR